MNFSVDFQGSTQGSAGLYIQGWYDFRVDSLSKGLCFMVMKNFLNSYCNKNILLQKTEEYIYIQYVSGNNEGGEQRVSS